VLLVLGAWLALSTGAPVGKDFLLWGFTALLVIVIGYLWQREGRKR
jgi:VIT1/CCC1 family predicted Fe2+/Mn2+ transporter